MMLYGRISRLQQKAVKNRMHMEIFYVLQYVMCGIVDITLTSAIGHSAIDHSAIVRTSRSSRLHIPYTSVHRP